MTNEIFEYMKETSREADNYTLKLVEQIKKEGKDIYDYVSHLPIIRNRLTKDGISESMPKSRNTLGRLIFECLCSDRKDWKEIIPALSFIELSVIASYVMDDLMDNQPERQGKEATWKKYGINKAIIAGGIQTFLSFNALDNLRVNDLAKGRAQDLARKMWYRLMIGQGFNEEMKEDTTLEGYINRCYDICGVTFDTIAEISAVCAKATEKNVEISNDIGKNYGIAVMIRNDLADLLPKVRKHSKALSKQYFEDLRKGIWTYPILYSIKNCEKKEQEILRRVVGRKEIDDKNFQKFYGILKDSGAIVSTLDLITEYRNKANDSIIKLPKCRERNLLSELMALLENLRGYV